MPHTLYVWIWTLWIVLPWKWQTCTEPRWMHVSSCGISLCGSSSSRSEASGSGSETRVTSDISHRMYIKKMIIWLTMWLMRKWSITPESLNMRNDAKMVSSSLNGVSSNDKPVRLLGNSCDAGKGSLYTIECELVPWDIMLPSYHKVHCFIVWRQCMVWQNL